MIKEYSYVDGVAVLLDHIGNTINNNYFSEKTEKYFSNTVYSESKEARSAFTLGMTWAYMLISTEAPKFYDFQISRDEIDKHNKFIEEKENGEK